MKNKNLTGGLFTRKALQPKETAVSASIAAYLDARGIYNDRLNSGKIFTGGKVINLCKVGTPDRFAILKGSGHAVFVEVKQRGEKATEVQLARHQELEQAGATVIVADSLESFISQFEKLLNQ